MSGIPAGAGSLLGKRLGKYEILALLALGGTAEIYLARIGGTAGFEKYVVVKCLHDHLADDADFVSMFLDEARLAAMLDHSNIVQTFELGEHENRYYMVMEFLAGLSLAMIVRRTNERLAGGRLPTQLILNIAAQAAAGLHYTHERTANGKPLIMVHRDISPQNLVISFEGIVKVVDFGIARAELRETKTKAGTIKGKFAYMSPEQCIATNVDRRTDVFALGVIVHELLTGKRLFKRGSAYETYQAVIECAVPAPSAINHELDPAIDEIVLKAVAKDKDERYPTAEAFGDAMLGYLHHRGKGSGPAELSRFFDQYFKQEIEEHGERMRELISGREVSVDTGIRWSDDDKKAETVNLGGDKEESLDLESSDVMEISVGSASLEEVVAGIGNPDDEDEIPADRTRIEANPLDKVRELDAAHAARHTPQPMRVPTGSITGGPAPLPAPPTGPQVRLDRPSGPRPAVQRKTQQEPALAPTQIGGEIVDPARAQTASQPVARPPDDGAPQRAGPSQPPGSYPPGPASPYPVMAGGRPWSSDLAPSNTPPPQRAPVFEPSIDPTALPFGSAAGRAQVPASDPKAAANLMSPVGDQYPHAIDWAAAAAQPAKAIPPWILAVLFVVALLVALGVTIVIAKIVR